MYRCAEQAYGALDFDGKGYITQKDFINSIVIKERVPYSEEEIKLYFVD